MAGMRPSVLYEEIASAYCHSLAAVGCPSSQIAIVNRQLFPSGRWLSAPRRRTLQTGPARVRFSFCADVSPELRRRSDLRHRVFFCAVADCGLARAPKPIYLMYVQTN